MSKITNSYIKDKKPKYFISQGLAIAVALCVSTLIIFIFITEIFVIQRRDYFDSKTFSFIDHFSSDKMTIVAIVISFFGTGTFLIPAYIAIMIYLNQNKRTDEVFTVFEISSSSLLLGLALKDLFRRPRPLLNHLDSAGGFSFPSGHTLGAFTFFGILIYLTWKSRYPFAVKSLLFTGSLLFATLVGLSRIYLHVHFATDVLGSICIAIIWFMLYIIYAECTRFKRT